jgi:hypothetical protein
LKEDNAKRRNPESVIKINEHYSVIKFFFGDGGNDSEVA